MFVRPLVYDLGVPRPSRAGDGILGNPLLGSISADANSTITTALIAGGVILRTGATVGRTDTTDTAANILAAYPSMDVGDSFLFVESNASGQTITLAGGVGVTASGNLSIPNGSAKICVLTKMSATTMNLVAL